MSQPRRLRNYSSRIHTVGVIVRTVFFLPLVVVGLLFTGCASDPPGGVVGTPPTTSASDISTPEASETSSPPVVAAQCTLNADGVDISYLVGDGSAGQFHGSLKFTNMGSQDCVLQGFPMVYFGNPETAGPIGAGSSDNGPTTAPVVLAASGGAAMAAVTITNAAVAGVCDPLESSKLLVRLPGAPDIPYSEGIGWARSVPIDPLPACLDASIGLIMVSSIVAG